MPKYDLVLIDNDNTLFDFEKAQKFAVRSTFEHFHCTYNEAVLKVFNGIGESLWSDYEKGKVQKEEINRLRFEKLFSQLSLTSIDAKSFNDCYLEFLSGCGCLLDGAAEVCKTLSRSCTLAVVTNGFSDVQRMHVNNTPVKNYVSHIIISDDIGYQKPQGEFFDCALRICGFSDRNKVIMVGDSLSADIAGAKNAGIASCWYNPKRLQRNVNAVKPDYEINSLYDLTGIILS